MGSGAVTTERTSYNLIKSYLNLIKKFGIEIWALCGD